MHKLALLAAVALTCIPCFSNASPAVVIASVSVQGDGLEQFDQFWLRLRSDTEGQVIEIPVKTHQATAHAAALPKNSGIAEQLVALPLPPGEYHYAGWRGTPYHRRGGSLFSDIYPGKVRTLQVQTGKAAYLGHVALTIDHFQQRALSITDQASRDVALAAEHWGTPVFADPVF